MTTWNLDKICTCGIRAQPCERHIYEDKETAIIKPSGDDLAYAMQDAYKTNSNRENACIDVLHKFSYADIDQLHAMWDAIDAYVDINIGFGNENILNEIRSELNKIDERECSKDVWDSVQCVLEDLDQVT